MYIVYAPKNVALQGLLLRKALIANARRSLLFSALLSTTPLPLFLPSFFTPKSKHLTSPESQPPVFFLSCPPLRVRPIQPNLSPNNSFNLTIQL